MTGSMETPKAGNTEVPNAGNQDAPIAELTTEGCEYLDARQHPEDCLGPEALAILESGFKATMQGDPGGAAERVRDAQEIHGSVSGHLEMAQGRLWAMAEDRENARTHFLESISIRDDSMHRVLWAMQLEEWDKCDEAEPEAGAALERPRHEEPGFNSHAEAHQVLASCARDRGESELGSKHMGEARRARPGDRLRFLGAGRSQVTAGKEEKMFLKALDLKPRQERMQRMTIRRAITEGWEMVPDRKRIDAAMAYIAAHGERIEKGEPPDSEILSEILEDTKYQTSTRQ